MTKEVKDARMRKKVAVIGLDGMPLHILKRLFKLGAIPNLKALMEHSLRGTLKSTIPPVSATAWTSIASGVNAGKHGVFDFLRFDDSYNFSLLTSKDVLFPRLHEMFSMKHLKSVTINLPLTWPILKMESSMVISDWVGPRISYYPKFLSEYGYLPYKFSAKERLESTYEETVKRVDAVNLLMRNLDWNLFFVVFTEPDKLFHRSYNEVLDGKELPLQILNKVDESVGEAIKLAQLVLIVSDHGFSSYKHVVSINDFLNQLGYIVKTNTPVLRTHQDFLRNDKRVVRRIKISPSIYKAFVSAKPLKRLVEKTYESVTGKHLQADLGYVDPRRSKAFACTFTSFGIEVNDEKITDHLINELKKLSCIENAWRREEIYNGPHVKRAPRILFSPNFKKGWHTAGIGGGRLYSRVTFRTVVHGHSPDGIFIAYGDKIPAGEIGEIETVDVVPTILSYMGLPTPKYTDGKQIRGIPVKNKAVKSYDYLRHWLLIKRTRKVVDSLHVQRRA